MEFVIPFPHHGPMPPELVRGRDELVADLVERVTARRPTVLVAPRRFGKTSVLGAVIARLDESVTVVRVDLYEVRSWADLAGRIDEGLSRVLGAPRDALDRVAAGFEINLGVVKAAFQRPSRPAPDATVDRLLDVLVTHALANSTLLVFDEFSSIVGVDGAAGLLRTKLQHHYQEIGLLFAGSEPSTMRMLFADTDQPFYAQADLVDVPPLDATALAEIVAAGFDGSPPAGLAGRIHRFTSGHPQRAMQLADAAWSVIQSSGTPAGELHADLVWPDALDAARRGTADGHEVRFAGLASADQAVMRLAVTDGVLFGRDAELLALSASSARASRQRLLTAGQIIERDGRIVVVDPLYADWIRNRFPL